MSKSANDGKKRGGGRPKLDLDESAIMAQAEDGAPVREIARMFNCDEAVIRHRFPKAVELGRDRRRQKIRKAQMDCAVAGNPTMLIWLGKQELDQTDKQTHEHSGQIALAPIKLDGDHEPATDRFVNSNGNGHNGNGKH